MSEKSEIRREQEKTVGIVMAAYNSEKFIGEQLDSILSGTYQNIHIYVRDDGSTDNTVAMIREYEEKYPLKVQLVANQTNGGLVKNFLTGVMEAKEDYIMFSDHDDVWLPQKVQITLAAMEKAEISGGELPIVVFTDNTIVDGQLKPMGASFYERSHFNLEQMGLSYMLMENKLIGCTMMINKPLKKMIRVLPEHARVHDWWIALIASAFGRIVFVEEQTMLYRQHGSNVIGNRSFFKYVADAAGNLKKQKEKLVLTERQAEEFLHLYQDMLTGEQKRLVEEFAYLETYPFLKRKSLVLKNKYLKSGLIRNIGVLLVI